MTRRQDITTATGFDRRVVVHEERRRRAVTHRGAALIALATAGLVWGLTVPGSKLALEWLGPAWLTFARFALAAPLLALVARRRLRGALSPSVIAWGALGYGVVLVVQNAGIERTSVSHAALIVGAMPALVALLAVALGTGTAGPRAWLGFGLALAGVGLVAGSGGGAGTEGDGLVLASVALSAVFVTVQPRLLAGRDPVAVTAVQVGAGALAALPLALLQEGLPPAPATAGPVAAVVGLALAGTALGYALFAFGQARVAPDLAGAFVNLEPLVGAAAGAVLFHDVFGAWQIAGALAVVVGIALSAISEPQRAARRPRRRHGALRPTVLGARRRSAHTRRRTGPSGPVRKRSAAAERRMKARG
jgi:drug/metabolite transporter (DMT)-like permease